MASVPRIDQSQAIQPSNEHAGLDSVKLWPVCKRLLDIVATESQVHKDLGILRRYLRHPEHGHTGFHQLLEKMDQCFEKMLHTKREFVSLKSKIDEALMKLPPSFLRKEFAQHPEPTEQRPKSLIASTELSGGRPESIPHTLASPGAGTQWGDTAAEDLRPAQDQPAEMSSCTADSTPEQEGKEHARGPESQSPEVVESKDEAERANEPPRYSDVAIGGREEKEHAHCVESGSEAATKTKDEAEQAHILVPDSDVAFNDQDKNQHVRSTEGEFDVASDSKDGADQANGPRRNSNAIISQEGYEHARGAESKLEAAINSKDGVEQANEPQRNPDAAVLGQEDNEHLHGVTCASEATDDDKGRIEQANGPQCNSDVIINDVQGDNEHAHSTESGLKAATSGEGGNGHVHSPSQDRNEDARGLECVSEAAINSEDQTERTNGSRNSSDIILGGRGPSSMPQNGKAALHTTKTTNSTLPVSPRQSPDDHVFDRQSDTCAAQERKPGEELARVVSVQMNSSRQRVSKAAATSSTPSDTPFRFPRGCSPEQAYGYRSESDSSESCSDLLAMFKRNGPPVTSSSSLTGRKRGVKSAPEAPSSCGAQGASAGNFELSPSRICHISDFIR
ncbi:MAG: hypothetical protein Q9165_007983 [Trypethelium subeluteriae]